MDTVVTKKKRFKDYKGVIEDTLYQEVIDLANELKGTKVLQVNATKYGGGVAEILHSLIPLMQDLGIDVHWQIIEGDNRLYDITKSFHNAFQGKEYDLTDQAKRTFERFNAYNAHILKGDWDVIMIHDPQPAALPYYMCNEKSKYIWRCHIDTSNPNKEMWKFFEPFLACYDAAVFTMPEFAPANFPTKNIYYIPPAIDPLVSKNVQISYSRARKIMKKFGVDINRPVITQISRFDPWKDPIGVIDAYRIAKKEIPELQLFMRGTMADDDPEGKEIYEMVKKHAGDDKDIILNTDKKVPDELIVNAFQSGSDIILQKSIREGFGLTVSEAMWKERPVIGGNCGGIKLQITNGESGYLVDSVEECAQRIVEILKSPFEAEIMGRNAKNMVRRNYLLPRLIRDELLIYKKLLTETKGKKKEKVLTK